MIDRRIKIRHLQCFVEIAREGSFKTAATKLSLTQPAISKTLKELEDILDCVLLTRNRGGGPNSRPVARCFLHFARMSIASLQQGIDGMVQHGQSGLRTLSVGVLPSVAARLIPTVAERFGAVAPDTVLCISDGPHGFLVDRLKLGELDLVIGRMGAHAEMKGGVVHDALSRACQLRPSRTGHPLLAEPVMADIGKLAAGPTPPKGSAIRPHGRPVSSSKTASTRLPRRIETVSGAFGRVYVRNSDAVWIISDGVVANEIANGTLARLPFNTDTTLGAIGIMTREDWDLHAGRKNNSAAYCGKQSRRCRAWRGDGGRASNARHGVGETL